MASLKPSPNGKVYYAELHYRDKNGKIKQTFRSTGISIRGSKKEALEIAKQMERQLNKFYKSRHIEDDEGLGDMYISEYALLWIDTIKGSVRENTRKSYSDIIYAHIIPLLGSIKLVELTERDLENFIDAELAICEERETVIKKRLEKDKNAKIRTNERPFYNSIRKHIRVIRIMLQYTLEKNVIEYNSVDRIRSIYKSKIPQKKYHSVPYNIEELIELRNKIRGHDIEVPVTIATYIGTRRSETLGLKWSDIDFGTKTIRIKNTCVLEGSRIVQREEELKTDSSFDELPLLPELEQYLHEVKKQQEEDKRIMGSAYKDSEYICRNKDGSIIKPNTLTQSFKRTLEKLGLRHIRFHDLRHSFGTIVLAESNDIKLASVLLRHTNIQTTADIYCNPDRAYKEKGLKMLLSNRKNSEV